MPEEALAGHPTFWRVWGEGPRPVLALHCSLAHGGVWASVAERLEGVTVTAPDLPGHGRSADWDGCGDYHAETTRIAAALARKIGGGGPVDVIGHSFGGTVALRLALERPDLVRSLTLIEPVLFAAARAAEDPAFREHEVAMAPFAEAMQTGDRDRASALFQGVWGAGPDYQTLPESQRAYIRDRIGLIPLQDMAMTRDTAGMLTFPRLESLGIPVLLLEGERSPAVVGAIQRELLRRLPQARRVIVPGAGHMVPISHPVPVAEAIAALLASS